MLEDYTWENITVPKGFVTDLDSVPRIPFIYALAKGRARVSAIIHDYLCVYSNLPQADVDKIFLKAMKAEGLGKFYRSLIFTAVRCYQVTLGKL